VQRQTEYNKHKPRGREKWRRELLEGADGEKKTDKLSVLADMQWASSWKVSLWLESLLLETIEKKLIF